MPQPKTRYAKSGDISIAYQVLGEGPNDLVFVPGFVSHLDAAWDDPGYAEWMTRLSGICRLILFDKRGTGLSDRDVGDSTIEERMDDLRAVLDAVGSRQCAVFGLSEGAALSMLFATTYPERATHLILFAGCICGRETPDFPPAIEQRRMFDDLRRDIDTRWGEGVLARFVAPSLADSADFAEAVGRLERAAASPRAARNHLRWVLEMDARPVARSLHVPSLILHREHDRTVPVGMSRWLAANIEGARYVEFAGDTHIPWFDADGAVFAAVEKFICGEGHHAEVDRVLATVLFTDIVNSTERAAALGDRRWRSILDTHHSTVRRELGRFRGREIDTAGDGFLAAFDGPARAIRCATTIRDTVRSLGIEIRAGVHTGECERIGEKLTGIAVHTGARVLGCAGPGEVWVSNTVKDLVAGSGLEFADRGLRQLKGVPGEWRLFAVV